VPDHHDGGVASSCRPLWMVQDYVKLARAGRLLLTSLNGQPLPSGTDSINLPRLATGYVDGGAGHPEHCGVEPDATSNSVPRTLRRSRATGCGGAVDRAVPGQHGRPSAG